MVQLREILLFFYNSLIANFRRHSMNRRAFVSHCIARSGWPAFRWLTIRMLLAGLLVNLTSCHALPTRKEVLHEAAASTAVEVSGEKGEQARQLQKDAGGDQTARLTRFAKADQAVGGGQLIAGNKVTLLIDGPATYQAMFAAMRKATRTIHLETYTLADDKIGKQFADALLERRAAGIKIEVIYDAIGSVNSSPEYFDRLRAHGIQVHEFHPVDAPDLLLFWRTNQRDHRKILVIDSKTAFIGGINISSVYSGRASSGSSSGSKKDPDLESRWRDTQVRIDGPAAAKVQELFTRAWARTGTDTAEVGHSASPAPKSAGHDVVRIIASEGNGDSYGIYKAYIVAISLARERVWITQAYFLPNDEFLEALKSAAKRGVDVRILLPGFTDSKIVLEASHSNYEDLLEAGVKLYERDDRLLHAKTAVIDGLWSTVGSSNLDYRSFLHNDEANAVILGQDFGTQMEALFQADLKHAHQIEVGQWERRSIWQHMKERFSVLFYYLI